MSQRHLFVIDPLASLNKALDSSLRMMFELARRGAEIHVAEPRQLAWRLGEPAASASCQRLTFGADATEVTADPEMSLSLAAFDGIHMRKDPPYDLDYITTTWILESAVGRARVYNDPAALRALNEKLAIFQFPEAAKPALLSADADELLRFIEDTCEGDAVIKPLTLFGGRGVLRIDLNGPEHDQKSARELLLRETANGTSQRLVQPFDPAIFEGEVRAFTVFGEPIAWCLKRPKSGEFLANTRAGATLEPYTPSPEEKERVTVVAEALMRQGVVFVGFDVIGGYLSEINITSPRLLAPTGDQTDYYGKIAEKILEDCG